MFSLLCDAETEPVSAAYLASPLGLPLYLPRRTQRPNNRCVRCSNEPIDLSHSQENSQLILLFFVYTGNFPILPLRTRTRGPAYTLPPLPAGSADIDIDPDSESYDILDEVISLYRANTFFRNFEIKGPADRMLIYGILFISQCLESVKPTMQAGEAQKVLINTALDHFAIPGDPTFPLNQAFEAPAHRQDAETLRQCVFEFPWFPSADC
jgi:actin related protein 2/3 complex subunit 3